MTYADGRVILDADSHVMELADFLDGFLEPQDLARMRRTTMDALSPVLTEATRRAERRRTDPEVAAAAEARLLQDKGWFAMGGFEAEERSRVLDLLGFEGQLVFATFASTMYLGRDVGRLYAGAAAQNRALQAFCDGDARLLPVAFVPLEDPVRAIATLDEALALGCAAVMVPSTAAGERSPTHPDLDGFWGRLEAANVPFVLHVGGGGRLLDPAFHNNGRPVTDRLAVGRTCARRTTSRSTTRRRSSWVCSSSTASSTASHDCAAGASSRERAGSSSWLRHLDHAQRAFRRTSRRSSSSPTRRRPTCTGTSSSPVPRRAGELDDGAGRPGAVHVLDGLPAPRGRTRPACLVRGAAGRRRRGRPRPLLSGEHGRAPARPARRGGRGGGMGGGPAAAHLDVVTRSRCSRAASEAAAAAGSPCHWPAPPGPRRPPSSPPGRGARRR